MNALNFLDGAGASHSGLPTFEYLDFLRHRTRPDDGQIDLGAHEYSAPVINSIKLDGDDCLIAFAAVAGNQYDLQRTSDLPSLVWSPVATNVPGIDGTVQIIDTNAAGQPKRFYRLGVRQN